MTGKILAGLLAGALLIQPAFAEGVPKSDPNARGTAATDSGAADLNANSKESGADHTAKSGTGSSSASSDDSSNTSTTHRSKKHKKSKGASSSPKQEASDAQGKSGT